MGEYALHGRRESDGMTTDNNTERKGPRWNGEAETVVRGGEVADQLDTAFDVLRAARRRYLLYYLTEATDGTTTIEDVVEAVRTYESTIRDSERLPARQSIRLELVHNHLPRLSAAGFVTYDTRRGTVRLRSPPACLDLARSLELG